MKKLILLFVGIILSIPCLRAQTNVDKIFRTDNKSIDCKILEVSETAVKYQKIAEGSKEELSMPKAEILMLQYADGRVVMIKNATSQKPEKKPEPESKPKPKPEPKPKREPSTDTSAFAKTVFGKMEKSILAGVGIQQAIGNRYGGTWGIDAQVRIKEKITVHAGFAYNYWGATLISPLVLKRTRGTEVHIGAGYYLLQNVYTQLSVGKMWANDIQRGVFQEKFKEKDNSFVLRLGAGLELSKKWRIGAEYIYAHQLHMIGIRAAMRINIPQF